MATKAKSTETSKTPAKAPVQPPVPAPPSPHAATLAKAVKLVDSGKHAEALKVLEPLLHEAQASGEWAIKRRAQVYLSLAQAHAHPTKAGAADPLVEAQAFLNRRQPAEALKLLDKLLKERPAVGKLHYLKALGHAQADKLEESAAALKRALELDADLVYLWHMEPDFSATRKSPLFGFTEGR